MIPTVWPVALNSPRLQLFERIIDADKIHTHIITSEYPRNFEEARHTLGRVVGDRAAGRLVFGTADTKAKMKVLALSSRTDVVADDFEIALDRLCASLSVEQQALLTKVSSVQPVEYSVLTYPVKSSSPIAPASLPQDPPPGCPFHVPNRTAESIETTPVAAGHLGHFYGETLVGQRITKVKNVFIQGTHDLVDISLDAIGMITQICPVKASQPLFAVSYSQAASVNSLGEIDAKYCTAIPGLVDAHVHLDKAYLLDRCCAKKGDFQEAMAETLAAKKCFTIADIVQRASLLVEKEISFGTTLLRSHVEVDCVVGLKGYEAIKFVREKYAELITIEICLFAQEVALNINCISIKY